MRVFDISINGKKTCVAGLEGYNVLTAILTSHVVDPKSHTGLQFPDTKEYLEMSIGGLDCSSNIHFMWATENLKTGDEIYIVIRESEKADVPLTYIPQDFHLTGNHEGINNREEILIHLPKKSST